jgi:hypothetical protein
MGLGTPKNWSEGPVSERKLVSGLADTHGAVAGSEGHGREACESAYWGRG